MWKDFLYFSGSQRAGIGLLLGLIFLIGIINALLPRLVASPQDDEELSARFQNEVTLFQASLQSIDSLRIAARSSTSSYTRSSTLSNLAPPTEYFHFDPNLLDSAGFRRLGLPAFMVSNILKYRSRGGIFRDAASFSKVYGLSQQQFEQLEPWIEFSTLTPTADSELLPPKGDDSVLRKEVALNDDVPEPSEVMKHSVELNLADTTALMVVKGIGRGFANAIVRYRQQSGGFVDPVQLLELPGMTPENFERILPYCKADTSLVQKINVNTASVERLRQHPYLNFYQARQIFELRRRKGRLTSLVELSNLSEIDSVTMLKVAPYLRFD